MFERFTEKAIKSVMLAQEEARRLGHNFVGTEQILLGLIGEANGCAGKALKHHGVTLKIARTEVEKIIGRGPGLVAVEIPFTPRVKRVLELSWDEARSLGHNFLGTEHLLLGLIREGEGVAARVLENCGVGLDELKVTVMTYITTMGSMPTDAGEIKVVVVTALEAQVKDLKESLEYQTTVTDDYREKCDKLEAEAADIKTEFGKLKGMAENLVATAEKLAETNAFLFRVLNLVLEIAEEKKS